MAPPEEVPPRLEAAEDLGPLTLFELYARTAGMPEDATVRGLVILQVRRSILVACIVRFSLQSEGSPETTKSSQPPDEIKYASLHSWLPSRDYQA